MKLQKDCTVCLYRWTLAKLLAPPFLPFSKFPGIVWRNPTTLLSAAMRDGIFDGVLGIKKRSNLYWKVPILYWGKHNVWWETVCTWRRFFIFLLGLHNLQFRFHLGIVLVKLKLRILSTKRPPKGQALLWKALLYGGNIREIFYDFKPVLKVFEWAFLSKSFIISERSSLFGLWGSGIALARMVLSFESDAYIRTLSCKMFSSMFRVVSPIMPSRLFWLISK